MLASPQFADRSFTEVFQDLNIPVPDPILLNNCDQDGDGDQPSSKRARIESISNAGTKVMILPEGSVKCNISICDTIGLVKPVIRGLVEDCEFIIYIYRFFFVYELFVMILANLLKMWISFMIPKIEDGNNFGVSIQEDTLAEIQSLESEAAAFFDQISRYFVSRAKVVSKVAKYPHVDDYRRAVQVILSRIS